MPCFTTSPYATKIEYITAAIDQKIHLPDLGPVTPLQPSNTFAHYQLGASRTLVGVRGYRTGAVRRKKHIFSPTQISPLDQYT